MTSLLLLGLLACRPSADTGHEGPRVVLLVLDGVRDEDTFGDGPSGITAGTPQDLLPASWDALVPLAARATGARSAGITVTGPAHVALLAGQHAPFGNYHNEEGVGTYRPDLPTLPESLRAQLGVARTQVLVTGNTTLHEPTAWSTTPGLGQAHGARWVLVGNSTNDTDPDNGGTDDKIVFDLLREEIAEHAPVLVVANLHQTDRSTHNGELEEYENHLTILDAQLPDFWTFLQEQPGYTDNTWLILAADHGRHDKADSSPPWRHHGDTCQGCRGVPWLVLGPGVRAGHDFSEPVLLEDTATTLAALLGVSLPFSTGRVIQEAFSTSLPAGPSGVLGLAVTDSAVAELRSVDDPAHRAQVLLDGAVVSDPGALLVAGPSLAQDGDNTWLCLRQLTDDLAADEVPWVHWCGERQGTGALEDLALPWTPAAPYEVPALLPDGDGGLVLITAANPTGVVSGSATNSLGLLALHHQDGTWTDSLLEVRESFPTLPAAVLEDGQALVVTAAGAPGADSRDSRALYTATWTLADNTWTELSPLVLDGPSEADGWAVERPALGLADDGSLVLAAVGHSLDETWLVRARSSDGGETWAQSDWLSDGRPVLPHLSPQIVDGSVRYGAWADGEAWVCTVAADGDSPACTGTGAPHLRAVAGGQDVQVVVERGDGLWEREAL